MKYHLTENSLIVETSTSNIWRTLEKLMMCNVNSRYQMYDLRGGYLYSTSAAWEDETMHAIFNQPRFIVFMGGGI